MANQSSVTEFLLVGFSSDRDIQILHFVMFLSIYLLALIGNSLIITVVALNQNLHTPMYFFLANLSLSDVCYISTTVPKSMATSLTNNKLIPFSGCVAQVFLVVTFVSLEFVLLTVMAYDRYVAICHPLRYRLIMTWDACIQMAAASWFGSLIHAVLQTSITFRLNFCRSNIIEQFFCDIPQVQKISCTDTQANVVLIFVLGFILDSFFFVFIFVSYGYILSFVMKIPSVQGRCKAFSTCIPHLTVFSLFIIPGVFSYMRPKALSTPMMDLVSAVLYTILLPLMNPIIYSLRNKDIKVALLKLPKKLQHFILGQLR
ncbi:olfactory receptor 14A16-like [Hemicordylus capensis]|uniref:olfactory receptor 14A16-like n=1 Tax=Hemicordylus capensis TaxID=884348 RepID=UPI002303AAF2|nr:olfactory receptor 14A16-like [Hemicordylus capensis]